MTEEKSQQPHPHEIMAEFMNKYEGIIKPELEKVVVSNGLNAIILEQGLRVVIFEQLFRFNCLEELKTNARRGTYACYRMAVNLLASLTQGEVEGKNFEYFKNTAEKYAQQMDLMLKDDSDYKQNREIQND